jgi:hypothetical protein
LIIRTRDEWLGVGREDQSLAGYWSNGNYYTKQHRLIPARLVTGWSLTEADEDKPARRTICKPATAE